MASQDERFLTLNFERCIDTCHEPLGSSFLIATGTIGLASRVESWEFLHFQGWIELQWIQKVIFNGIGRTHEFHVFQAGNGTQEGILHIDWHGGRHPLHIHFIGIESFWFDEELVPFFIRKTNHLVFNGRAIPSAYTVNFSCVFGGTHQIISDNLMGGFVGISQPAISLISIFSFIHERKGMVFWISCFQFHVVEVQTSNIHTTRSTCFKAENIQTMFFQIL